MGIRIGVGHHLLNGIYRYGYTMIVFLWYRVLYIFPRSFPHVRDLPDPLY